MADEDAYRLKVAELRQQDIGKGIIRLSQQCMAKIGVDKGGVVDVRGKRATAALAVPAYPEDETLDVVRMDGLVRSNAGVGLGEHVELRKGEWKEAKSIVLAPAKEGMRIQGSGEGLRPVLLHRPLTQGDVISTSVFRGGGPSSPQEGDIFRALFQAQAFGLMEIRLLVVATTPRGIVRVSDQTEIELAPEYTEPKDREVPQVTYDDLGGIKHVIDKVREMIELPLKHPEIFDRLGIDPPKGVLLHGPPGTGKTLLARAVAHESDAHFISLNGPEIMGKYYGESEQRLRDLFEEAEKSSPAIVFIDELDSIAPRRADVTGEVERRIVAQLLTLLDGLDARKNVIVIGATNRVEAIDPALRRPGRFDREIEVRIPDQAGRLEILHIHTRGMPLAENVSLESIAELTHGYTGSDIAALAREAALATLRRVIPTLNLEDGTIPPEVLDQLTVTGDDFEEGRHEVQPSALREIVVELPNITWEDVGGLEDVKRELRELVVLPLRHPDAFTRLGIHPPKGLVLYGPPGTGKTMLAKAVASEAGANFLVAKGSALLSKWYGESEKRIEEFFRRARQVTPSILFFDELDSLAPARGGSLGEPQVTERVVNQLLAELDGMIELKGVAVMAATNRPDIVDPALLRPGRFDELVYVPVPDEAAREAIFRAHTRQMKLGSDIDLKKLAQMTERFTGADIAGVSTRAGVLALRDDPEAEAVGMDQFLKAVEESIPSVTEEMLKQYDKLERKVKQQSYRIGFMRE